MHILDNGSLDLLLNEFNDETERPIIIPADDYSLTIIDGSLHMLDEKFVVPSIETSNMLS